MAILDLEDMIFKPVEFAVKFSVRCGDYEKNSIDAATAFRTKRGKGGQILRKPPKFWECFVLKR